jgi:hypothetical protein
MSGVDSHTEGEQFLATALATRWERRLALAIATACFVLFIAIVPSAWAPLPKIPAFIPSFAAALIFADLITALLLYEQAARLRSTAVLTLASGYLFDAIIIVPHALTFPGAFAPAGLLGAGPQTSAWLYVFWHGVFPLLVMAYALLRRRAGRRLRRTGPAIGASIAGVSALVIALTLVTTVGHDRLPVMIRGADYSLAVAKGITPAVWALTLLAMVLLWQRRQRVLDLWLMLVMWIWLLDIALSAVIGASRFDLGWYAGRLFGLMAANFLLIALLVEMAKIHAGAVGAAASAERRLIEIARARARSDPPPPKGGATEAFIRRQNIVHYRTLLESGRLDEAQRRSIERLLWEEESKQNSERTSKS